MTTPALIAPAVSSYPPSFAGDPVTFGWALFSLITITSLSTAIILEVIRRWWGSGVTINEPLGIVMAGLVSLLATIWLGAIGDVAFLLAWGEVAPDTMARILDFDRMCDASTSPAFGVFCFLLIRGQYLVHFQLTSPTALQGDLWPTWPMVRRQMLSIAVLLFIAVGVTLSK
ncbi:hypothetical protein [Sphingomonas sanxanigenens]|uniref:Uncharacterized protein n=1 Tax=Sphingomonas sanxanigenens DSM 19645 = NX02 TaxID=1123269 RepID=W0AH00_9SPHN|nr:hypothetical protein [Sphingomonas sanxanigenens]AHE55548.1 hypothetical protein NX02_19440 [Sphingomonas sanxanigenens DSM 19645 = NX02]AHE57442.1 hypothetical protein NX02_29390 [Sphingomonas sanxanigenens DSM 19645 = NX02]